MRRLSCGFAVAVLVLASAGNVRAQKSWAFIADYNSFVITPVDTDTNVAGPDISTPGPYWVDVQPDGRRLLVSASGLSIRVIDFATRAVVTTLAVHNGFYGGAFSPDGKTYYISARSDDLVTVIDLDTLTVSGTPIALPAGAEPRSIAVTPNGEWAYVASAHGLYPIYLPTRTVHPVISLFGGSAAGVAIRADGQLAYVSVPPHDTVYRVNLNTSTISGWFSVGNNPLGVTISPDNSFLYIANFQQFNVEVYDVATNFFVTTISVPDAPTGIAFNPTGSRAYIAAVDENSLMAVDVTNDHTPLTTINAGGLVDIKTGSFVTPALITAPMDVANDAALTTLGFRRYIPFHNGTLRLTGPFTTNRELSMLSTGGTFDTNGFDAELAGNIINDGRLTKTGDGTLTLLPATVSTHTAGTRVSQGTLVLDGTHAVPLEVAGGILRGTGTAGDVSLTSGAIDPGSGAAPGPGILHASNVTMASGATFRVDIVNPTAGTGYDRLEVSGTAAINGATLEVSSTFAAVGGEQFTILTNATGTFAGLPEGSIVTGAPGRRFRLSYVGGSGHDVTLTADGPPSLTGIVNRTVDEDAGVISVPITIGDDLIDPSALTVTVSSSNTALVPDANVAVAGSGAARVVTMTALENESGTTQVDVTIGDGVWSVSQSIVLTVQPVNDPPVISAIGAQSVPENTPLPPIAFTVSDVETDAADLTVTATSSNQALVPNENLVIEGEGENWTIAATPRTGVRGETVLTVTVSDGAVSASRSFTLTVSEATYYLAEGANGGFFGTDILLANPNAAPAPVSITFMTSTGASIVQARALPPMSRTTIRAADVAGLEDATFSTIVTSTEALPIVVERTMRWDASGYGAHTEKATAGAAPVWYFAEGSQGFFSTFLLLGNPQAAANTAHLTWFREGEPALERDYPLGPGSRATVDAGNEPELVNRSFGARVTFDLPGVAERAMYFGTEPMWFGGHAAAGTTVPSTSWFLAEGATGSYFTTFLLLANPNDEPADVTLTYFPETGVPVTKTDTIAGRARMTRNIAVEDATLANAAVATRVEATRPIVAERSQYWGVPSWIEAHNSPGVTAPGLRWGLAEGRVGGGDEAQTYILLANPNAGTEAATVTISFLRASGGPIVKQFSVPPTSRFNVAATPFDGSMVPELANEVFGALIESTQPIVVERSVYTNANGLTWAAGSNATATRLP